MLEIADREFEAIQTQDSTLRTKAIASVEEGHLDSVEITPYALKTYLDKKLGTDARMSDFSYEYLAKQLREIGFSDFGQIDKCIAGLDDDKISRIVTGVRQGQITRFEYMLLVGMGEFYIAYFIRLGWSWYTMYLKRNMEKLQKAGIEIRSYIPGNK